MDESRLIGKLSRRAGVPRATARAVLKALLDLLQEEDVSRHTLLSSGSLGFAEPAGWALNPGANHSDPRVVDELIARARTHSLGVEFLLNGFLASVAAEFNTHAFTVEAARQRLRDELRHEGSSGRDS
jgi:hypothetical protein